MTLSSLTLPWKVDLPESLDGRVALLEDGFVACASNFFFDPNTDNQQSKVSVRRFDRQGQPRGPVERAGWPATQNTDEGFCRITSGGDRLLVTWEQPVPQPSDISYKLFARQTDVLGKPLGEILELSGQFGVSSSSFGVPLWNGEEFGVVWISSRNENVYLTRIPRFPSESSPTTILITNNVFGNRHYVQQIAATWSGDAYLLAFGAFKDPIASMGTMRVGRDGVPFSLGEQTSGFGHGGVALGQGSNEAMMAWIELDTQFPIIRIWYQFVDPQTGQPLAPGPRELKASKVFSNGSNPVWPSIIWTGEMFILSLTDLYWNGNEYDYDHWIWRILADGTSLDPLGIRLSGPGPRADLYNLVWDGKDLWSFYSMKSPREFRRSRIACSCTDLDHDGRNACVDDCDDTNSLISPARPEVCTGGLDDDCDGYVDCADSNCSLGPGPVEVSGLLWTGSSLTWTPTPTATRYAVARGLLSDLIRRGDMRNAECPVFETLSNSWFDDGRRPAVGDVLWYEVRAEAGPCRYGSWGSEPLRSTIQACD